MCGIVGLFLKDNNLNNQLGHLLSNMLITMSDRGPDSSGIAIYNKSNDGQIKLTLRSEDPDQDLKKLKQELIHKKKLKLTVIKNFNHIILRIYKKDFSYIKNYIKNFFPLASLMSSEKISKFIKK
tara:strand:+ start:5198 stop:5572 length:375 start_codon:yes stop_codon:yes gene_type:complete